MKISGQTLRITAIIAGLGVSLVILGVAIIVGNNIGNQTVTAAATYQTSTVKRGSIEAVVNAPGVVKAARDLNLTFQVNGIVSQVQVVPGQVVKKNDLLAQLDTRELDLGVSLAQSRLKEAQAKLELIKTTSAKDLITAQANLKQAQARLENARAGNSTRPEVAAAKADLDKAQAEYQRLTGQPNANDIAVAEANLKQANAKLEQLKAGPDGQALKKAEAVLEGAKQNFIKVKSDKANSKEIARINRDQAQKNSDQADAAYKKIYEQNHNADGSLKANVTQAQQEAEAKAKSDMDKAHSDLDRAKSELTNAEQQEIAGVNEAQALVNQTQADLDQLKAGPGAQAIIGAQAEVEKAQAFLNKAKEGPTRAQIAAAQADLDKAKANYDKLTGGGTDRDIAIAQAEVEKAQAILDDLNKGPKAAELNQAQAGLEGADNALKQAQLKLEQAALRAPFDGIVNTVNMLPGQSVGFVAAGLATSNAGTIGLLDMTSLQVELTVGDSDVVRLKTAQTARITLDVIGKDKPLEGTVTYIATKPSPLLNQPGVNGYQVLVQLKSSGSIATATTLNDPLSLGIKPGMSGNVRLVTAKKADALVIPNKALKKLGSDNIVEVLGKNGQLIVVPIKLGAIGETESEILEPSLLRPTDQIVLGIALGSKSIRENNENIELKATATPGLNLSPKP